jgi:hypothetical protein
MGLKDPYTNLLPFEELYLMGYKTV